MAEAGGGGEQAPVPERKGRFKIKQVEAAEGEHLAGAEAAIVGGRIKGTDHDEPSRSMSRHGSEASISMSITDTSEASTLSRASSCKELKKGRFIIRELPEDLTDTSSPVPSHPGTPSAVTPSHNHHGHHGQHHGHHGGHHHPGPHHPTPPGPHHHVQIDPQVYLHQLPSRPHTAPASKPPLHPPVHHHPDTPLSASAASEHFAHHNVHSGAGGRAPEMIYYHHQASMSGAPSPLTSSGCPTEFFTTGAGNFDRLLIDADVAKIIKQQNEQILAKLQLLEKSVAHPPPAVPAAPSSAAMGGEAKRESKPVKPEDSSTLGRSESGASSSKDSTLGKLSYHLEQMKMEVEAATAKRKELDMQMKRLQERNRALEEKVDEEKRQRLAAEKKAERFKEKYEQVAAEMQHIQEQLAAVQQQQQQQPQQQQQQQQQSGGGTSAQHTPSSSNADFDFMQGHLAAPIPKPHAGDMSIEDLVAGNNPPVKTALPPRMTSSPSPQVKPGSSGGDPFNGLMSLGGSTTSLSSNPGISHGRSQSGPTAPPKDDAFSELVARKPAQGSSSGAKATAPPQASSRGNLV